MLLETKVIIIVKFISISYTYAYLINWSVIGASLLCPFEDIWYDFFTLLTWGKVIKKLHLDSFKFPNQPLIKDTHLHASSYKFRHAILLPQFWHSIFSAHPPPVVSECNNKILHLSGLVQPITQFPLEHTISQHQQHRASISALSFADDGSPPKAHHDFG